MTRTVLTEAAIAAMASGITLQASVAPVPAVTAVPAPAAEGIGGAAPAPAAAVAAPVVEAAAAAAPAPAATPGVANTEVLAYLQGQVAAKDTALLAANVENANLKAQLADLQASAGGLKLIAADSLNNMRVALGGSRTDLTAMTATEILAQHETAKTTFQTKFPAGGVAAVDAVADTKATREKPDALENARLNAVYAAHKRA